jgi:hypothetical protein
MENIMDLFKKSPDYDENLSFDKMIKSWEENCLGTGQHNEDFSYPTETDNSFDNAATVIDKNIDVMDAKILPMLFDQNITIKDDGIDNFTCINESCMNKNSHRVGHNDNKELKNINTWNIVRNCDAVSKPFFRLILKKNISEKEILNLLYLLSDCSFSIIIGGSVYLEIPKLLFIFLVCEKLSHSINIFDVNEFLESNTMSEIKKMTVKMTNNACHINQKYYVRNKDDFYLDIPLLIDFFSYGMSTQIICLQYHDVRFELKIPENKIKMISNYIDDIVLMFEDNNYSNTPQRKKLAQKSFEFIKMTTTLDYYHCWSDNYIELCGDSFEKFIFIVVRQHEVSDYESGIVNQLDGDVDVTQFPQISRIELEDNNHKQFDISLDRMWVGQFDNVIIYGIAADGVSDMSNWIKVLSESVESIEDLNLDSVHKNNDDNNDDGNNYSKKARNVNNLNSNNYEGMYLVSNLNKIKISWYNTNIPVNVEIIHINQNIQRMMGGMSGDAYAHGSYSSMGGYSN